jgi:hypothetical protein
VRQPRHPQRSLQPFTIGSTRFRQLRRSKRKTAPQTALIVAIRNRMAQLNRAEDHASIGIGHNSRAALS